MYSNQVTESAGNSCGFMVSLIVFIIFILAAIFSVGIGIAASSKSNKLAESALTDSAHVEANYQYQFNK